MKAFIIGNGPSRRGYDLSRIKDEGTMFGCNALYRDYYKKHDLPHFLVAIDEKIITEIECSDFPSTRFIVPPYEEQFEPQEYRPGVLTRSNAGMNACLEAIKKGFGELYLLGFDFIVADKEIATGNLYDGTNAYEMETRASFSDSINRVKYFEWFANKFPDVTFYFVIPQGTDVHPLNTQNVRGMYYEELFPAPPELTPKNSQK